MDHRPPAPELRTAEHMLDTCAELIARSSADAARAGHDREALEHAAFIARCVMRVAHTRALHRDFLRLALTDARRLLGEDPALDGAALFAALHVADRMHGRALRECA